MIEIAKGIPEFDEPGNLPHKCYEVTLEEIKEKLEPYGRYREMGNDE